MRNLLAILISVAAVPAGANGWMQESPSFGAKEMISEFKARLISEELNIKLLNTHYEVEVIYMLKKSETGYPMEGIMTFPVLCAEPSKYAEASEVSGACISSFTAEVTGKKAEVSIEEVSGLGPLIGGYAAMVKAAEMAARNYSESDMQPAADPARVKLDLRKFYVSGLEVFPIKIRYSAPYYSYEAGFTKSSFYYYSNDVFFYDFSPAATWTEGALESFRINVDANEISGALEFGEGHEFSEHDRIFIEKKTNIGISDVKPLIISIGSRFRKQYESHWKSLERAKLDWKLSADSQLDNYPIANAQDNNPGTAWCIKAKSAAVTLKIIGKKESGYCRLEGLAVMNGYNKSEAIYKANRRIKGGKISYKGIDNYPEKGRAFEYKQAFSMADLFQDRQWSPYLNIRYFAGNIPNKNFSAQRVDIADGYAVDYDPELGSDTVIELQIDDSYPGEKHEDMCVSEIYPVVNCG